MKGQKLGIAACLLWSLAFICTLPALAVEKGKVSTTAEVVCAFRSIAALDPDPKTRNPDSMAQYFVNPDMMGRFPGLGLEFEDAKVAMDYLDTGTFYYVNARTLHMDNLLQQALDGGVSQVVILGAGFDSRAYRFHKQYPEVRFFEIDLPATSEDKQKRVEKILKEKPGWVNFVAIDFNSQTLDEVLEKAGFAYNRKSFYIWEGVTYFISGVAVDDTLNFIAKRSAPDSQLVFDYMLEDVIQGADYSAYGSRKTVFWVALHGEPYVFGIAPKNLEGYVNHHGLKLLSDLGPQQLTRRYLLDSQGKPRGKIAEFLRIVHAEVPQPDEKNQLITKAAASVDQLGITSPPLQKVKIPEEVQQLLDQQIHCFKTKNLEALKDNYSESYLQDGYGKNDLIAFVRGLFQSAEFENYDIMLTRFEQDGERAMIDGYVDRKMFRIPLMVQHIIREADGRWRWIGNQH